MDPSLVLTAPWVLPVTRPPIRDGHVLVARGHILDVGPWRGEAIPPGATVRRLDDCVLTPGLVNAHAHLELSDLRGRVPYSGSFVHWLLKVAGARYSSNYKPLEAAQRGLSEAEFSGTTTIADVTNSHIAPCGRARVVSLFETLGVEPHEAPVRFEHLKQAVERHLSDGGLAGLAPHAPYTTSPELYRLCRDYARAKKIPLATHVAEVPEELDLLVTGAEAFAALFPEGTGRPSNWKPPGLSPVEYLGKLGCLSKRALLFHANYATTEDIELIADRGASVVYCPRSHHFFNHPPYPVLDMLRFGVGVCLGTDSLASNDSLDLRQEMALVCDTFPSLDPGQVLRMGTLTGAEALGLDARIGSLESMKAPEIVAFPLADPSDPYSFMWDQRPPKLVLFPLSAPDAEVMTPDRP